jgi:hypothetical protein
MDVVMPRGYQYFRLFQRTYLVTLGVALTCGAALVTGRGAQADSLKAHIIEGTPISEGAFPYVARLSFQGGLLCTGTLVAPRHILTAAHCFFDESGRRSVSDTALVARLNGEEVSSTKITVHPSYRAGPSACVEGKTDAALVELSRDMAGIEPVQLYTSQIPRGAILILVGYGLEGSGNSGEGDTIPELGLVNYGTTVLEGFGDTVGEDNNESSYYYWQFDPGESNTASGDSGGPAFYDLGGRRFLSGITCGGDESVEYGTYSWNTRADRIANWVASITGITSPTPPLTPNPGSPTLGQSLTVSRGVLQYDGTRTDFLELSGKIYVGNKFSPQAKRVTIEIGDYRKSFRLGRTARSADKTGSSFQLRGSLRRGRFRDQTVSYAVNFERVRLFEALESLGFSHSEEAVEDQEATLPLSLTINGVNHRVNPIFRFDLDTEQWRIGE